MKLNYIFALFIICFVFASSCTNEEPENPILGTWKYITYSRTACDNSYQNSLDNHPYEEIITYYSTGIFETSRSKQSGTYEITGNELTTCYTGEGACETVSFSISDNKLTKTLVNDNSIFEGCVVTRVFTKQSSKTPDPPEPHDSDLLGTWKYISNSYSDCDDPDHEQNVVYDDVTTITYNTDGTFLLGDGYVGSYSVSGSDKTNCYPESEFCLTQSFLIEGDTLTETRHHWAWAGCTITTVLIRQ